MAHFNEQQERKRVVHQELRSRTIDWYWTTFNEGGPGGCWARKEGAFLKPGMTYEDQVIALDELWYDGMEYISEEPSPTATTCAQEERLRIMKYVQGYDDEDEEDEEDEEECEEEQEAVKNWDDKNRECWQCKKCRGWEDWGIPCCGKTKFGDLR